MNSVVEHRQLVEEILTEELMPQHPYIEMIDSRSGPRPVIKGTPIGSDVLVGYSQAGYSSHDIVETVLLHLMLAQVYDALSYYEDHHVLVQPFQPGGHTASGNAMLVSAAP